MMNFTVIWRPAAEQELTSLWLASRSKYGLRDAANEIDRALRCDPLNVGESRNANRRIAIEGPLVVEFEVREDDRVVLVTAVRTF